MLRNAFEIAIERGVRVQGRTSVDMGYHVNLRLLLSILLRLSEGERINCERVGEVRGGSIMEQSCAGEDGN